MSLNFTNTFFDDDHDDAAARQHRRRAGLWLGGVAGLVYGVVSAFINQWVLWGIPLRSGLGDNWLAIALSVTGMAAVGYVTALSASSFKGVLAGALGIAVYGVLRAYLIPNGTAESLVATTLILITVFLPSAALALIIVGPLRVAINFYEDGWHYTGRPRVYRVGRVWVALVLVSGVVGSFAQWSSHAQAAVREINTLLQTTLTSGVTPPALSSIGNLRARLSPHYTLDQYSDFSADTSFANAQTEETIVVDVLFDTGLHLQCLVGQRLAQALCSEVP